MDGKPKLLDQLRGAIRARHYSRRTEDVYALALQEFGLTNVFYNPAAAGGGDWNVEGQYSGSVDEVVARDFVEHFVRLAHAANSTFDGWGTRL